MRNSNPARCVAAYKVRLYLSRAASVYLVLLYFRSTSKVTGTTLKFKSARNFSKYSFRDPIAQVKIDCDLIKPTSRAVHRPA